MLEGKGKGKSKKQKAKSKNGFRPLHEEMKTTLGRKAILPPRQVFAFCFSLFAFCFSLFAFLPDLADAVLPVGLMAARIRIGTSGWHYKHWVGTFYPDKTPASRMFEYYRQFFDCVELNNTFYRLPRPDAVEGWRAAAPRGFRFAVKGSRFITHMKKLKDPGPALQKFFEPIELLRSYLGPVVFQLPPSWRPNPERFREFLAALPRRHRYAFELRDARWIREDILDLLREFDAAFCIWDLKGIASPRIVTTDFAYVRLHGPSVRAYEGSYDDRALDDWAGWIHEQRTKLREVHVYFDNDQAGIAPFDALRLLTRVGDGRRSKAGGIPDSEFRGELAKARI